MDLGHMNVVLKWMYLYVNSVCRTWNIFLKSFICSTGGGFRATRPCHGRIEAMPRNFIDFRP